MPIDSSFLRNVPAPQTGPGEAIQRYLTMREMIDRRKQNEDLRAHQQLQWRQAEEDRQRKMSLINLLRENPNATEAEILKTDPFSGMPLIKERADQKEAQQRAEAERRRGEEVQQKVDAANRVWQANLAGSLLQEKDLKKRTDLFNQYTPAMVTLGMLTPEEAAEHMGDEPTIWKVIERGLGLEGMQNYRDKIAKAARDEAEEARKVALHGPAVERATAEATHAQQVATGTQPAGPRIPVPGVDVPYPPQVFEQRKDIAALRAPVPGTDVPLPPAVAAQRVQIATDTAAGKPANQAAFKTKSLTLKNLDDAVTGYQRELETTGPTFLPEKGAKLKANFTNLQMLTKNLFELGVITGPDMQILQGAITDPTGVRGNFMGTKALLEQLGVMKSIIERSRNNLKEVYGQGGTESPPPQQTTQGGVPTVGQTFNGGKVLKVTKVQ